MLVHKKIFFLFSIITLSACSTPTQNLYHWGKYEATLYQYYQPGKTTPEQQIVALNQIIQKAAAKGVAVPPGLHAHLGMLYVTTGRNDEAFQQFEIEKTLFPEAAPFMDFLLKKHKGSLK